MGLFSLIARKLNPDKYQSQVRAPPFESKISSKSPVRIVQPAPVSSTASEENYKAKVRRVTSSQAHVSPSLDHVHTVSANSAIEDEAPAPVVLGFRGDAPGRPSARPSTASAYGSRHSFLLKPPSRSGSISASNRPQSSLSSKRHSASVRSFSTATPHIDLLDAQSELRPLDFHGRITASGARDYGEDVADRNIRANNTIRESPAPVERVQRRLSSPWNLQAPVYEEEGDEDEFQGSRRAPFPSKKTPLSTELKKKALLQSMRRVSPTVLEEFHSTPTLAELRAIVKQQELLEKDKKHSEKTFKYAVSNHNQLDLSPQPAPSSHSSSSSWAGSDHTVSKRRPVTMHSLQSVKSSRQQQLPTTRDIHNDITDLSSLSGHGRERARTLEHDWDDDVADRDSAPSPCIRINRSRSVSRDSLYMQEHYLAENRSTSRPRSSQPTNPEDGLSHASRHSSVSSASPTTPDLCTEEVRSPTPTIRQRPLKDSEVPFLVPSSEPFIIDNYESDDNESFVEGQVGRPENEEDLLFMNGYGIGGMQLPGLAVPFASAPPPTAPVRLSRRSSAVSHSEAGNIGARFDFNDLASVNSFELTGSSSFDDDEEYNIGRRRHSPEPVETILRTVSPFGGFTGSMSRRFDTTHLAATRESASAASDNVLRRSSLQFLPSHKAHHLHDTDVGKLAIDEERYDDHFDIATAVRLHDDTMVQRRASLMSFVVQPKSSCTVAKAASIEGFHRSSNGPRQASAKGCIPNIVDVPELTEDVGGHIDSE